MHWHYSFSFLFSQKIPQSIKENVTSVVHWFKTCLILPMLHRGKLVKFYDQSRRFYLGIEFYLFVSHGGMNYRGSTCKFRNARSAFRNLHVDPLSFIPP